MRGGYRFPERFPLTATVLLRRRYVLVFSSLTFKNARGLAFLRGTCGEPAEVFRRLDSGSIGTLRRRIVSDQEEKKSFLFRKPIAFAPINVRADLASPISLKVPSRTSGEARLIRCGSRKNSRLAIVPTRKDVVSLSLFENYLPDETSGLYSWSFRRTPFNFLNC